MLVDIFEVLLRILLQSCVVAVNKHIAFNTKEQQTKSKNKKAIKTATDKLR